ncbi:putative ribosomal protein S6 kinase alpha-1 [Amphibalanus amphitrite]|uniref:Putative ribosomal protein S6 kinase alpha-1 n=1 Tax=Amphibalanus amphitrite TaxID=1232801 RepID=A0A6A4XH43_AMPAM|nr:putative ribosomal protein S6 kinase alpha-1 [Amphibalanus amphitrite]
MPQVACQKFTVSRDSMVTRAAARAARWKKLPTDRGKLSDKESGFESSPNSPRAESGLEHAQHAPGSQELALRGPQEEQHISLDCFEFIKKLGSGGYGSVVLVQKKGGRDHRAHYALKMTALNRAALVERDILPRLQNVPYTLDLAYAFFDARLGKAFLVLPFAAGKDLFSLAGPCTNPKKKPGYLRRMFHHNYIKYLHRVRLILAELCVAISYLHKTQVTGKTGTPDYMAPEVLQSSGSFCAATTYSFEADLWGLGVIAYELIVGQLPFRGQEISELECAILGGAVEVPRSFLEEKFGRLSRQERALALAALSFVKALLRVSPRHRLTNDDIPRHIFFQDLDFEQIATGDHDDPPFDIRRIDAERDDSRDVEPIPAAFAGRLSVASSAKSPDKSGFDSPSRFANYHYVRRPSGWYFSDLEGSQCEDSRADLPDGAGYAEEAALDHSAAEESCVALEDVPGLLEYEAILAEDTSVESDDLVLLMPGGWRPDRQRHTHVVASSESRSDSAIDERHVEHDAEAAAPPMAASTPVKTEIELFPRVRVVPSQPCSPPRCSPALPAAARTMPNLLPVASVRRRLRLDEVSPPPAARRVTRRLAAATAGVSPPRPEADHSESSLSTVHQSSLSTVHQSCTPSRFERDSPLSPSPEKTPRADQHSLRLEGDSSLSQSAEWSGEAWQSLSSAYQSCTPSRFERDSPLSPSPEKTPDQEQRSPAAGRAWELLSPAGQSCTSSQFEGESSFSVTPEKTLSSARGAGSNRGSPAASASRSVIRSWAPPPTPPPPSSAERSWTQAERDAALFFSPVGMPAASAFEEVHNSGTSEQLSDGSARLHTALGRPGGSPAGLAAAAASPVRPSMKRSWVSPCDEEPGPSRARPRRAAAAAAAAALAADTSPHLPPKKRRRFRAPEPSGARWPSPLVGDGPRVVVEAAGQPLPVYSLRSAGRR